MTAPKRYAIEEFLGTTNYTGASFSPDNCTLLVSSDASGIYNAYAIRISDGTVTQLTHSTSDSIFAMVKDRPRGPSLTFPTMSAFYTGAIAAVTNSAICMSSIPTVQSPT
jgi:hypothetical protein